MKTQHATQRITLKAAAAIAQNRFVTFAGAVAGAGAFAAGPAYMKAAANEHVAVTVAGSAPAVAGAAISIGDELQVGADGKVITKAAGKRVAFAQEAAAADGDELLVLIDRGS